MVPLADVISDLRAELWSAIKAGEEEDLRFEVGDVELELTVGFTKEGGVGAKVRFWVVELGSEGKVASTSTQKLTLKLSPRVAATGAAPYVSGLQKEGEGAGGVSR